MTAKFRRRSRKSTRARCRLGKKTFFTVTGLVLLGTAGFFFWEIMRAFPGKERLTLVVNFRPILVASIDRQQKELLLVQIPERVMIPVSGGYGSYPASSVWGLARQEEAGVELVTKSFRELLGLPIDFAIDAQEEAGETNGLLLSRQLKAILAKCFWGRIDCGQMTKKELITTWLFLRGISGEKATSFSLDSLPGSKREVLADGSEVLVVDEEGLDLLLGRYVVVNRVREEGISLGIFNATGYPGLAKRASRILANLGGRVLVVDDWKETREECELRAGEDIKKKATYRIVKEIFNCRESGEKGESEVDLTILVGREYLREL